MYINICLNISAHRSTYTYTHLRHDGDRDRRLDLSDHLGVGHAGDAAVHADVGGDALERHDGHGAGLLGDACLLDVDHVCSNGEGSSGGGKEGRSMVDDGRRSRQGGGGRRGETRRGPRKEA